MVGVDRHVMLYVPSCTNEDHICLIEKDLTLNKNTASTEVETTVVKSLNLQYLGNKFGNPVNA